MWELEYAKWKLELSTVIFSDEKIQLRWTTWDKIIIGTKEGRKEALNVVFTVAAALLW